MRYILSLFLCVLSGSAWASYDLPYMGEQKSYIVQKDDTLVHIARDKKLGFVELRAANPHVDPWLPEEGATLILPSLHIFPDAPHEGIVINLPEMRLYAFLHGDKAPSTFPLGIGRDGLETPMGLTKVVRKKDGPTWYPTARMRREDPSLPRVFPAGADNPLGTHALYLGWPTYAIHGTNKPYGIGRRVSSGCIRLYPEGIKELFAIVPVGTPVRVVNQPIKLAWIDDTLYLEAHPDMEQAIQMEEAGYVYTAAMNDDALQKIMAEAGEYRGLLNWALIRDAVRQRRGYPIAIATRPSSPEKKAAVVEPEAGKNVKADLKKAEAYDSEVSKSEAVQADANDQPLDVVHMSEALHESANQVAVKISKSLNP